MTADNDILILYVDFGEGQSLTTRSVRQTGEIWAVAGRTVARVAALKLHRARTVA